MKRIAPIVIISIVMVIPLISCHKQCHNRWENTEMPTLSDTGYNTCNAIFYNYSLVTESANEAELYNGQIVKVCGWFMHSNSVYRIAITDNPNFAGEDDIVYDETYKTIYCNFSNNPMLFPNVDSVDLTKKCYVTGTLQMVDLPTGEGRKTSPCQSYMPQINVTDLYYEE
jgi:hypothetical protein